MKKILLFICTTMLAFAMTHCSDGSCTRDYKVINQTEFSISIELKKNGEQIIIEPNEEREIYERWGLCGVGEIPQDGYSEEEMILDASMRIDGELIPDAIWKRKYWSFANKESYAVYTLTVTNELIEMTYNEEL
jgi:hypothetical protein